MRNSIKANLNDPKQLEKLYRSNKGQFKKEFNSLYPELKGNASADFWNERLNFDGEQISWGSGRELLFVIIASLLAGVIAKFPAIFSINEDYFYPRNIGFIVFPFLAAYFAWKNQLPLRKIVLVAGIMLLSCIYINYLPDVKNSDTLILSCIHLGLFLWSVMGFTFVGKGIGNLDLRLGFLKYNGDLVVMGALILIAGGIMSAITIGLFSLIGINIEIFYGKYIAVFGVCAVPLVGTYLTRTNPLLVGKVSPVIAKLFSPLVAVMLVVYLVSIVYAGKDPYNDRAFLMVFNALLVGVMALIFFSVAETSRDAKKNAQTWVLLVLSVLTIIVNGVALSAILFRIVELGITPNRVAVMGGNVLILVNLIMVTVKLFKVLFKNAALESVGIAIAVYLPVYIVWTIIVTFLFPVLFSFI
ncbi:MAG: hypothetical protein EOO89_22960 [Pedobacter sp.]|nr:MAG: hypothetical protein EOO89_22960 [Pedobacter sp.]